MSKGIGTGEIAKLLLALLVLVGMILLVTTMKSKLSDSSKKLDDTATKNLDSVKEEYYDILTIQRVLKIR